MTDVDGYILVYWTGTCRCSGRSLLLAQSDHRVLGSISVSLDQSQWCHGPVSVVSWTSLSGVMHGLSGVMHGLSGVMHGSRERVGLRAKDVRFQFYRAL